MTTSRKTGWGVDRIDEDRPPLSPSRPLRSLLLLLGALVLLLELGTASWRYSSGDGAAEIDLAGRGFVLRAQHLLQTPLVRSSILAARGLGWSGPAHVPPLLLNALAGAVAAPLVVLLLLRYRIPSAYAFGAGLAWAFSFTPWDHGRGTDTGMTPMPLLLGAALLARPSPGGSTGRGAARLASASLLLGLAGCLSTNVLFVAPLLVAEGWLASPTRRGRFRLLAAAALPAALLFGAVLLGAAASDGGLGPGRFAPWVSRWTPAGAMHAGVGGLGRIPRAATGLLRLAAPPSAGETAVKSLLRGGDRVVVRPADLASLARNLLLGTILVLLVIAGVGLRRSDPSSIPLLAAIPATALFSLLWLGSDPQFWLPVYPFLLALAAGGAARLATTRARRRWSAAAAGALAVVLVAGNAPANVPSPFFPRGGTDWQRASAAATHLSDADLVLFPGGSSLRDLGALRPAVELLDLSHSFLPEGDPAAALAAIDARIDAALARGGRVFLDSAREPLPAGVLGGWELVRGRFRLSRAALLEGMERHRRLVPSGFDRGLEEIVPGK
jgi:hypothetical protein